MSDNAYSIRGKDFCNCDHAQAMVQALVDIETELANNEKPLASILQIVEQALNANDDAERDYQEL